VSVKRFWAPWRMEYIRGLKEKGCFLCKALAGTDDRANLVVRRGRTVATVINRYPYNNGHLMVCPYRHVAEIEALTPEERLETMDEVARAIAALRPAMRPAGFNVGVNLGRAAGAGLEEHLHVHIVPRWDGDTNFMPVLADVKVVPQSLLELWDLLHPALNPPA
jgi:ATP adenylyltransferase